MFQSKVVNPIIRGFNPDPNILKVGSSYYVKRSQDWKKIGAEIDVQTLTGGFTGNFVGIGVHDLNVRGGSYADFDYFNYQEIEME